MSATTKAKRQSSIRKPAKKQTKQAPAKQAKRIAKPEPIDTTEVMSDRSAAISFAMKELADVRTAAREKRNGVPAKHVVFGEWFKALLAGKRLDVEAVAKRFPEVKPSTVAAWCNAWRNLSNLPSVARGKEKQIAVALKKLK